jgi:hypothetical protein
VLEVFGGTQQPKYQREFGQGVCPSASTSPSMDSRPWPMTASSTHPTIQYSVVAIIIVVSIYYPNNVPQQYYYIN